MYSCSCSRRTLSEWVLFDVLSTDGDVFEEALSGMGTALLDRVLGTKSEHGQVLQGQHELDQSEMQLLCKNLTDLVALVLFFPDRGVRGRNSSQSYKRVGRSQN